MSEFVIGAQYYRPPNPPRADWESDLARMAAMGMNTVKLWACWSWMNPRPGDYDFADLDRLMDIARDVGLKVVINVILEDAPYWLEQAVPEARYCDAEDRPVHLTAAMNTPGGGWPGLCFHNDAVTNAGLAFLAAVADRYARHPTLLCWDVWNEPHLEPASYFPERLYCYCDASITHFRGWLQRRYGTLDALNERWARRFSQWSQVEPPRLFEAVPDMLDWREFWFETLRAWLDARVAVARNADGTHPVTTHVALSGFTGQLATHTLDEWTLAGAVDGFGTSSFPTWLMADDLVEHMMNLDTARAASAGKPFWQTELQGGKGRRNGTLSTGHPRPEIVTLEMWNALAAGASGVLFWQWRPELLGPEAPGYGLCAVDGSPTERTRAAARFAEMLKREPVFTQLRPKPAPIGLLLSRGTALHAFATDRTMNIYRTSVMAAYRMLLDADVEVEFLHAETIEREGIPDQVRSIYWPMPAVASEALAGTLAGWVAGGGRLVSEASPGEYDERGWHRHALPPPALAELFGYAEVEADAISGSIAFTIDGAQMLGAWTRQTLVLGSAEVMGQFADGAPAVVRNAHGAGVGILIASCPSVAYSAQGSVDQREGIRGLLAALDHSDVVWTKPTPGLVRRRHELPGGASATIALNWTTTEAVLRCPHPGTVHSTLASRKVSRGESIKVPAGSAAMVVVEP